MRVSSPYRTLKACVSEIFAGYLTVQSLSQANRPISELDYSLHLLNHWLIIRPYDNDASDENDESGDSENDDDDRYVEESDEAENGTTIDSKLDLLSQVLDSDQVKEQLPEAVLEQLAQKLDHWRSQHEESELEDDDLGPIRRGAKVDE